MKFLLLLCAALAVSVTAEKTRFDNYKVYRVNAASDHQIDLLKDLEENSFDFVFWENVGKVGDTADIMVAPNKETEFTKIMTDAGFTYEITIDNVQSKIDHEENARKSRAGFGWSAYYTLDEIYAWLKKIASEHSQVEVIKGGSSYEGREILGIKISYRSGNPGVFVESGIHAREWITPATVTYIANQLLTSTDPAIRDIAENYDWYIFPSTNPDGYVHTHTTYRMWRKTRTPYSGCYGADPNRNWGYQWMQGGASSNPCSDTFAGPAPFSEIETRSLSEYITSIQSKISTYLAFHSYSQLLLLPYGHTKAPLDNYAELMQIAGKAVASLAKRYGTKYQYGNIAEAIYIASGGSMDWVKGTYGTPITFTYELRDTGRNGFLLPPEEIIPTADETLDSVITILNEAKARNYYKWTN